MATTAAGVAKATNHGDKPDVDFDSSSGSEQQNRTALPTASEPAKRGNFASRAWNSIRGVPPSQQPNHGNEEDSLPRTASQSSVDEKKDTDFNEIHQVETSQTTFEAGANGLLYNEGQLVLIPAASDDPRDPLNMATWRKFVALFFLCVFGAMAASAELILGAMLPVFALYYAGFEPKYLLELSKVGLPLGSDPLKILSQLPNAEPIQKIYLLASLPVLILGASNLILVPLAISCGRRPVVLGTGILAIAGACWAGGSKSLTSHLLARCLQALGAGTVESLIPFIVQDMVHVHQRNFAISGVFAAQGIIIIGLGIAAPYLIVYIGWRWVYFITAIAAGVFLVGVFFFMPETRWNRTKAMMNGVKPVTTEAQRQSFQPRTLKYDIALWQGKMEWRKGFQAFIDTLRTFFYPHIFFITMLNSAMIGAAFAAGYTVAPALLTQPWKWNFLHLGLCLVPVLISSIFVGILTGRLADDIANWVAKKRGFRVPENQILNLIVPTLAGVVGSVIFGIAGQHPDQYHWAVFLLGLGLMAFGFLGANTVGAVYVLECYPNLAGPALVNIASFRCLIAFILSFRVSDWIADMGYFNTMIIYTAIISFFALLLPVVYIFGPAWRKRWPGPQGSAL